MTDQLYVLVEHGKISMMAHAFCTRKCEGETGRSVSVPGLPGLYSKFEYSQGYTLGPCELRTKQS